MLDLKIWIGFQRILIAKRAHRYFRSVSETTIRRDLTELENAGELIRTTIIFYISKNLQEKK